MSIKFFIASVLVLTAAGAASAASGPDATRQQVVAELASARAAGELTFADSSYPVPAKETPGSATRADVIAEFQRARAAGELVYNDATYPLSPPASAPGLTRQEVRAEAAQARANGELNCEEVTGTPCLATQPRQASK